MHSALTERLFERRAEIEQAMLMRVQAVADPAEVGDPEYAVGLRTAVGIALDYAIAEIDAGEREPTPVPVQLLAQARAAARNGVPLDTVLRRYLACYTLFGDFVIQEADERGCLQGVTDLQDRLRIEAVLFERMVLAISEAYASETESRLRSVAKRRAEQVKMLLAGEPIDPEELRYEFDAWHLAAIASGPGAIEALRDLAAALARSLLLVRPEEGTVWVWLGGSSRLSTGEVLLTAERSLPAEVSLALGEPGKGIEGWRLSHRQARAAMPVIQRGKGQRVRYAEVALLASALRDDVLASSLQEIYLGPLERGKDRGVPLLETLQAYFVAGRNASSAAASLGVSRQTVSIRLRTVEERIDRSLEGCAAEMEVALRLRDLSGQAAMPRLG